MMHDGEKSDSSKVAKKQANKAERSAAEPVERREGAKGNAEQDGMHRTPSRNGMSPGLVRVRTAARLDEKVRFTALLHHVDVDLLREAYLLLEREAASGKRSGWDDVARIRRSSRRAIAGPSRTRVCGAEWGQSRFNCRRSFPLLAACRAEAA